MNRILAILSVLLIAPILLGENEVSTTKLGRYTQQFLFSWPKTCRLWIGNQDPLVFSVLTRDQQAAESIAELWVTKYEMANHEFLAAYEIKARASATKTDGFDQREFDNDMLGMSHRVTQAYFYDNALDIYLMLHLKLTEIERYKLGDEAAAIREARRMDQLKAHLKSRQEFAPGR